MPCMTAKKGDPRRDFFNSAACPPADESTTVDPSSMQQWSSAWSRFAVTGHCHHAAVGLKGKLLPLLHEPPAAARGAVCAIAVP